MTVELCLVMNCVQLCNQYIKFWKQIFRGGVFVFESHSVRRGVCWIYEALSQYPGTARYLGFSRIIFNPGISLIPGTIAR